MPFGALWTLKHCSHFIITNSKQRRKNEHQEDNYVCTAINPQMSHNLCMCSRILLRFLLTCEHVCKYCEIWFVCNSRSEKLEIKPLPLDQNFCRSFLSLPLSLDMRIHMRESGFHFIFTDNDTTYFGHYGSVPPCKRITAVSFVKN